MNFLGRRGRLGNQMFQFAALVGIAESNKLDFMIPDHSPFRDFGGYCYHELQHCFKLPGVKFGNIESNTVYAVDSYHYDETVMKQCPDNVSLMGYFESEKYFSNIKNKIKALFEFKDGIIQECEKYGKDFLVKNPVAVVVRRGDFLRPEEQPYHPVCLPEYYIEALSDFPERPLMIFSDDIEWCKEQTYFTEREHFFVEYTGSVPKGHFDLCLMTMCNDFIIANSTFSWWGAWLSTNPHKKVIAPKKWFGPALSHLIITDQIPEQWKRV